MDKPWKCWKSLNSVRNVYSFEYYVVNNKHMYLTRKMLKYMYVGPYDVDTRNETIKLTSRVHVGNL